MGGTASPFPCSQHLWETLPPLFNNLEVLSSASDKVELFPENFSKNSNLDLMTQVSLYMFSLLELI